MKCHKVACSPWLVWQLLLMLAVTAGCTPLDLHTRLPWQDDEAEADRPRKIVAFWSDTVMHQQGKPGVRGFGGRVFFYGEDENKPVEVDGSMIVYAFDAERHDPAKQAPEKKFIFTAEQMPDHFSESRMGPSYSFWLPWDNVQGPTRNVSIVARFEGSDGTVVIADPIAKLLPGTGELASRRKETKVDAKTGEVRPVDFQEIVRIPIGPPSPRRPTIQAALSRPNRSICHPASCDDCRKRRPTRQPGVTKHATSRPAVAQLVRARRSRLPPLRTRLSH